MDGFKGSRIDRRLGALLLIALLLTLILGWSPIRDQTGQSYSPAAVVDQAERDSAQGSRTGGANKSGETRFAVIGDYGQGSSEEETVADLVAGWDPDFIVTTGDNRYGATTFDQVVGRYYCRFLKDAGTGSYCPGGTAATNAFYPSPGNHDYSDGAGIDEYLSYFTLPGAGVTSSSSSGNERYYDVLQGPVHLFILDSHRALVYATDMGAQQNWLQTQLAASPAPWKIVIMHHPPFSSGSHGSQTTMRLPYAAWGADFVLAGHDHTYERIAADGITYFVNGLGGRSIYGFGAPVTGSQVRYNDDYGAMLVEASESQIAFHFTSRSGEVVDAYTYQKSRPPGGEVEPRIYAPLCTVGHSR